MRAITLHQPWASLIATGKKRYETRSWGINYTGDLLIHAAKKKMGRTERFLWRENGDSSEPPLGAIVAIARLEGCYRMEWSDAGFRNWVNIKSIPAQERLLGHWVPGRFAWRFEDIRPLEKPISCRGRQGIWHYEGIDLLPLFRQ